MQLEELRVYQSAMEIRESIWQIVKKWDCYAKETVGKQLIRAVDSKAANLSEGCGRYHFKENKQFGYYSRGSLSETKTWLIKANNRKLIKNSDFEKFTGDINSIGKQLNSYISSIGKKVTNPDETNQ